ncbi:PRMT5 [Blepharisma stoltei]|uniref:Protein arginine N-methyltransferase n=1 Tax=Blepharisma stoltei TaxID=1481888 RepID=A0AAU9IL84_9CILI|nr:unnamed protein product [Blepharisma stoltei]
MFPCPEFPWQLYVGKETNYPANIQQELQKAVNESFDFLRVPLSHPRYSQHPDIKRNNAFTRSDFCLPSDQWNNCIQGKCNPNINPDSSCPKLREKWEKEMGRQIDWAVHLGVNAIVLPTPQLHCTNFARILNQYLEKGFYYQKVHVEIPADKWEIWNALRCMVGPSTALGVSLVITKELPEEKILDRWFGEPIMNVHIPRHIFLKNKQGFPVLPKEHQVFIQKLFKLKASVLIGSARDAEQIRGYICYLFKNQPRLNKIQSFSIDYWDNLQIPLQPLMHNLESMTYDIFEKDTVKYLLYENAIYSALKDNENYRIIMVVGAGRGPIASAALRAGRKAQRNIKVYALDKNPNAIVTLYNLLSTDWAGENIEVIESDMREWKPEEKADILVSELLGSFGDNELEPECLECAKHLVKEGGISIPCESISYLSPVSSQKNWTNAITVEKVPETPYVSMLHNFYSPWTTQKCFQFNYPSPSSNYSRFSSFKFPVATPLTIHGFGGYFESKLYKDITLSTVPETHSKDMCSWFPMYFPIKEPIFCPGGSEIEISVWRCCGSGKVWYEWVINMWKDGMLYKSSGLHNPNGKTYWIGVR